MIGSQIPESHEQHRTVRPLGIIGSSGGSALIAAVECLSQTGIVLPFVIVTDRACGLAQWASDCQMPCHRVEYSSAEQFSSRALKIFQAAGVEHTVMYYSRLVSAPLISEMNIWNIHPSLLPAFPGLSAVKQALHNGARMLGATLHRVDEGMDTGPISAQTACALPCDTSLISASKLSFLQKVWLTLVWFETVSEALKVGQDMPVAAAASSGNTFTTPLNAWPSLCHPNLMAAFEQLQNEEQRHVIDIKRL